MSVERWLETQFGQFASERVFWLGYSEGGALVLDLITRRRYGGAVVVGSSWLESSPVETNAWMAETPLLMLHGLEDPVWPCWLAQKTMAQYREKSSAFAQLKTFPKKGHEMISSEASGMLSVLKLCIGLTWV